MYRFFLVPYVNKKINQKQNKKLSVEVTDSNWQGSELQSPKSDSRQKKLRIQEDYSRSGQSKKSAF